MGSGRDGYTPQLNALGYRDVVGFASLLVAVLSCIVETFTFTNSYSSTA